MTDPALLELAVRELAEKLPELKRLRAEGLGFALVLFPFEPAIAPVAYVSQARRGDLVQALGSLVLGFAGGNLRSAFDRGRPS